MYASSVIGSVRRIECILERLLSMPVYDSAESVRSLVGTAFLTVEETGALLEVLAPIASVDGFTQAAGDEAVTALLSARIDGGIETPLDSGTVDRARELGRIAVVEGYAIVPVGREMPAVRNWWLLTDVLVDWLAELEDGYRRVERRAATGASDAITGAVESVVAMLSDLRSTLTQCRSLGRYLVASANHGTDRLLHTVERFAGVINA